MDTNKKKQNITQISTQIHEKYNPNKYLRTSDQILVKTVGVIFGLEYGYWEIMKWNLNNPVDEILSMQDDSN